MTFKRVYLTGGLNGKFDEDDFIVGYQSDNGKFIEIRFLFGNESFREYHVDGKMFSTLSEAKAYCQQ